MKRKGKNPFRLKQKNTLLEVWYGQPDDPESDFILCVDASLIPSLIAALRGFTNDR